MLPTWLKWSPVWNPAWLGGASPAGGLPFDRLTFTRAGTKYYVKKDGTVALAPANTPCIGLKGLLIEPAITNQVPSDITSVGWQIQGTPTIVGNAAVAPDGTTTASQLTTDNLVNRIYIAPGGSGPFTPSLWINRVSTSGTLNLVSTSGPGFGNMDINLALLGAGWTRVFPGHPATSNFTAFSGGGFAIQGGSGSVTVYTWEVQNEPGTVMHSNVHTGNGGPVTCPKDVAYFSGLSIPAAATISVHGTPRSAMADGSIHTLFDTRDRTTGLAGCAAYIDSTGKLVGLFKDGSANTTTFSTAAPLTWAALQSYAVALSWDGAGNATLTRDGVLVATGASQRVIPVATTLSVGLLQAGDTSPFDGWLSDLRPH